MIGARMLLSTWPLLLVLLWPPWPQLSLNVVGGVGVEPPSASNSMSMASSLLQTLADNEFTVAGDSLSGEHGHEHGEILNNYRPEECRVKNLKQQQKMSMCGVVRCTTVLDHSITIPLDFNL